MNSELCLKASEKVGNPNILVNIISRRLRQLNAGGSRPLIENTANMGNADIALTELLEDKISYKLLEDEPTEEST